MRRIIKYSVCQCSFQKFDQRRNEVRPLEQFGVLGHACPHRAVALAIADRRSDNPDFLAIRVLGNISLNVVRILRNRRFGRRGKHDPLDNRRAADDLFWPHHLREGVLKTLPGRDRILLDRSEGPSRDFPLDAKPRSERGFMRHQVGGRHQSVEAWRLIPTGLSDMGFDFKPATRLMKSARETLSVPHVGMPA